MSAPRCCESCSLSLWCCCPSRVEIADSGVTPLVHVSRCSGLLWRPGTRREWPRAAAVGFLTAASTTMSVVFAPLLLARVIALPRLREHAVTAGWARAACCSFPTS